MSTEKKEKAHDLRPQLERRTRRFTEGRWTLDDFARTYQELVQSDVAVLGADGETGEGLSLLAIFMCIFQSRLVEELHRAKEEDPADGVDFEEVLKKFMEKESQLYTLLSIMATDELEGRRRWQAQRPDPREEALEGYLRDTAVSAPVAAGADPEAPPPAPDPVVAEVAEELASLASGDVGDSEGSESGTSAEEPEFEVVQKRSRRARWRARWRARKQLHPAAPHLNLPAPSRHASPAR